MVEYHTEALQNDAVSQKRLDVLGKQGWQLVTIANGIAYFKQVEQPKTATRKRATK